MIGGVGVCSVLGGRACGISGRSASFFAVSRGKVDSLMAWVGVVGGEVRLAAVRGEKQAKVT